MKRKTLCVIGVVSILVILISGLIVKILDMDVDVNSYYTKYH